MLSRLRFWVRDYFGFSQAENKGFWAVVFLLILLPFSALISYLLPATNSSLLSQDKAKTDSLIALIEVKQQAAKTNFYDDNDNRFSNRDHEDFAPTKSFKLFPFDPNVISADQWKALGLPPFLAERIVKYRTAGGKFRKKEDLQRIYGLRPETYERLVPYIQFDKVAQTDSPSENNANTATKPEPLPEKPKPNAITQFDLNKADTTQLVKIRGIGSKLASRIIKFRDNLGGFYTENQLREVFGLDSTVIDETLKYAYVRSPLLRKIKINEVTAEEFRHPYLKPYVAKAIIAYRQQHGHFASAKDLANIKVLDAKTLEKITAYLEF